MKIEHKEGRFSAKTNHGDAELLYTKSNSGNIEVYHTFVPPEERGKGIAEGLALAAIEYAKKNKVKIVPKCSYMVHFFETHEKLRPLSAEN